jgi:F-type H+-transporting ATPase subunit b
MIAMIINIAIFVVVFWWFLRKPAKDFLQNRAESVKNDMEFAEAEKAKANELKLQYEQKVKDVDAEKQEILEMARATAAEKARESEAADKDEASAIKARALKEIEMEQERIKENVKKTVIDVSSIMCAKFLKQAIDEETQDRMFDETMAELEGIAWHN